MTPQDRSLLIGGASFVLAMVALYLGMAILGPGDGVVTTDEAARTEANDDAERAIDIGDGASADLAARQIDDDPSGGIDPAGPSASSSTTVAPAASSTTEAPAASLSTTTALVATTAPTAPPTPPPSEPSTTEPSTTEPPTTEPPTTVAPTTPVPPSPTSAPETSVVSEPTTVTTLGSTTVATDPAPPADALDPVEQEIVRLTNELRADPSGPLARQKPLPDCVSDPFYAIAVDAATGHPGAVDTLTVNIAVSTEMSRPWAVEMDAQNNLQHRPNGSQIEIYERLGIAIAATGENIAWFSGYPDEQAARIHFEGWRESDTGHYCAMVSGTYTNIGVGHLKGATRSWAVQNFYRQR